MVALLHRFQQNSLVKWNRLAVLHHTFKIAFDRFRHVLTCLFKHIALRHQTWQGRAKSDIATLFGRFEKHGISKFAHRNPSLNRTRRTRFLLPSKFVVEVGALITSRQSKIGMWSSEFQAWLELIQSLSSITGASEYVFLWPVCSKPSRQKA